MKLIDIVTEDVQLKKTSKNEFSGPCPVCGGKDRFVIFLPSDRFWCRGGNNGGNGCGIKGDVIDYLRIVRKMTWNEAVQVSGKQINKPIKEIEVNIPWKNHKKIEVKPPTIPRIEAIPRPVPNKTPKTSDTVMGPDFIPDYPCPPERSTQPNHQCELIPGLSPFMALHSARQERGCYDCEFLRETACIGGAYPRLILVTDECPKGLVQ